MKKAWFHRGKDSARFAMPIAMALFCIVSQPAICAEFIPVNSESGPIASAKDHSLKKVQLIPANECFAALQPIAVPFDIFREGIDALVESTLGHERDLACVSSALDQWALYATPEKKPTTAEPPAFSSSILNISYQADLEKKLKCFNSATPGTEAFQAYATANELACKGAWLSAEEAALLEQKLNRESKRNSILLSLQNAENLVTVVQTAWQNSLQAKVKLSNGKTPEETVKCYSPDAPTSPDYIKQLTAFPQCGPKLLGPEEIEPLFAEWAKIGEPLFKKVEALSGYLAELKSTNPRARVFQMARNAACFHGYEPGSEEADIFRRIVADRCGSFGIKPVSEMDAYKSRIAAETDKLVPELEKWIKKDALAKQAAEAEYERLNPERNRDYNTRRLLSRLQFHLSHGGKASELYSFCQAYEEEQRQDLRYANEGLFFNPFSRDQDWELAATAGFTEGQLSAIYSYTGAFYRTINQAIWKKAANAELEPRLAIYQEQLERGLARTPEYRGVLRRFSLLPDEVLALHQEGQVVTYSAYTSTSTDLDWKWNGGLSGRSHSFTIFSRHGKDLTKISPMANEKEVLFRAGARFKVLSRKERAAVPGAFDFVMAEVDEAGNVIADLPAELAEVKEKK